MEQAFGLFGRSGYLLNFWKISNGAFGIDDS
jgi:hypothetical protein